MVQREIHPSRHSPHVQKMLHGKSPATQRKILHAHIKAIRLKLARKGIRPYTAPLFYPAHGITTTTIKHVLERWQKKTPNNEEPMSYHKILATSKAEHGKKTSAAANIVAKRFVTREYLSVARKAGFTPSVVRVYEHLLNATGKSLRVPRTKENPEGILPILDPTPLILVKLINRVGEHKVRELMDLTSREGARIQKQAHDYLRENTNRRSDVFANIAPTLGAKVMTVGMYQDQIMDVAKDTWDIIQNRNHLRNVIRKEHSIENGRILDAQFEKEMTEGIQELSSYLIHSNRSISEVMTTK